MELNNHNGHPCLTDRQYEKLEGEILKNANDEYFSSMADRGFKRRITRAQARCLIHAWLDRVVPMFKD